jgi:hypothetical protein
LRRASVDGRLSEDCHRQPEGCRCNRNGLVIAVNELQPDRAVGLGELRRKQMRRFLR